MSLASGCPWRQDSRGELSRVRSVASGCPASCCGLGDLKTLRILVFFFFLNGDQILFSSFVIVY